MQTTQETREQRPPREQREPREQGPENEIRVSNRTDVLRAVERAVTAFNNFDTVKLSAINSGITNLIIIVEITKIKVAGLHQLNRLETLVKERGGEGEEQRQGYLTAFKVELSKTRPSTVPAGYVYQAPYTPEHIEAVKSVQTEHAEEGEGRRGGFRGRGRGGRGGFRGRGRGGFRGRGDANVAGEESERGGFRGRGRGRGGRGGRGRGRGGNDNFRGGDRDNFRGGDRENFRGGDRENFRGGRGEGRGSFRGNRGGDRDNFRGGDRENFRGGRGGDRENFRGGRGGEGRGAPRGGNAPQQAPVQTRTTIPGLSGPKSGPVRK